MPDPHIPRTIGSPWYQHHSAARTSQARAQADIHHLEQVVEEALGCDCPKLAEEQAL